MKERYVIAALSDIHSNLTALDAVLEDVNKHDTDEIIIAGDHVGDGPDVSTVVQKLMDMDAHIIKGNREDYLAGYHAGMHPEWEDSVQMMSLKWTYDQLSPVQLDWLLSLDEQMTVNIPCAKIRIVHGSPRRINELIYRDDHDLMREVLADVDENILVCGHCHQQYNTYIDSTLIVNPGSLGIPFIEPGYTPYTLLVYENGEWRAYERQVKFDLASYLNRITESGWVENCGPWARSIVVSLKSGQVVTLAFLKFAGEFARAQGWNGAGVIPNELYLEADKCFDWGRHESGVLL